MEEYSNPPDDETAPSGNADDETTSSGNVFEDVKERVPLEKYFGDYLKVDFRPSGAGRLLGLCPYHDEDTPSFTVFEDGQSFMCFGCEKNGTIIDAVMFKEGYEEPIEAVQWLNEYYGLGLRQDSDAYAKFKSNVEAAKKGSENAEEKLWDPSSTLGQQGLKALKKRGLTEETIKAFELGATERDGGRIAIPIRDKGNHIITIVTRSIFDRWECKSCKKMNGSKDIFVVKDKGGDPTKCLHCGEKTIPSFFVQQHPKYRNPKNYAKARVLYNEPSARKAMFDKEKDVPLLIMEGYGDVWACHQAGFTTSVCYNGSSISSQQAQEAIKITQRAQKLTGKPHKYILLVPDFDNTGHLAVTKNIKQIRAIDDTTEIKVLFGVDKFFYTDDVGEDHNCKDLGELLQHHGEAVVTKVLAENRMSADEFRIKEMLNFDHFTKEMQIQHVAAILAEVKHTIELDSLVPEIATKWKVPEREVKRFLYSEVAHKESSVGGGLISDIVDAHLAAVEYLKDGFVIKTGYPTIDRCLPGGGFRLKQLSLWLGKSGVGKTNLVLNLMKNIAKYQGLPTIFFSLEQPKAQLYMRLVQMVLEVDSEKATEIVRENNEEELAKVDDLFKNLIIIDGVPAEGNERPEMNPATITRLIQEVNLTRFATPTAVVFVDHLSMCRPGADAPRSAKEDENALSGYLMEEFFSVCKETNTLFIVLQQLPKEVRPGREFSYDAGRGGSRQTDFSDYIFCLYRPEQNEELDEEERLAVEGQYKIKIGKNRHGMSKTCHCTFDWHSLKIEESEVLMPLPAHEGSHPVESIVDNKELVNELIEETDGQGSGLNDIDDKSVPSWFDK